MALANTITVAASAPTPALTFARTEGPVNGGGKFSDVTNGYDLMFANTAAPNKTQRNYMKITQIKDATNPYTGGISKQEASVSISASFPPFGWDAAAKAALVKALTDALADSDVTTALFVSNTAL
ncbi:coat protein [ssRNA phage SRR5466725_21]|uniref:Coat protein n=1 Tax=ssRNA phage SRR5466725_21 TaxID=2786420 RepID=A0A8S5L3Z8_9VIRU|nr:coat protein [ssRNA phage SRR5466725_21]DAD52393.1 TPA_asm: coat protein [ssRNA phage SRR5466725_21]